MLGKMKHARLMRLSAPTLFVTLGYNIHYNLHTNCDAENQPSSKISSYTYPANHPTEDRHIYGKADGWNYGAVFDGHGGWQVAEFASKTLPQVILKNLQNISSKNELEIDKQMIKSFQETEDLIVQSIRPAFQMGFGEVGHVGSCVLFAMHNKQNLIVANCGDCRAVLGTVKTNNNKTEVLSTQINREHNCRVPLEQAILAKQHPNESNLIVCKSERACYVKGRLQLTRSLGDVYLKYREFNGTGIPG